MPGEEVEELSSDEEEADYSKMPTQENAEAKERNLFQELTADIDKGMMATKQA